MQKLRYETQGEEVFSLALVQLNKDKNKCKPDFETFPITALIHLIEDELIELKEELFLKIQDNNNETLEFLAPKKINKIDFKRVYEELGDVAATLIGLYSKCKSIERALNE